MPFQRIAAEVPKKGSIAKGSMKQYPIFLLPDIGGNGGSILALGREIQAARGNLADVHIWHDIQAPKNKRSLSDYAEQIKNEILESNLNGPYFISGFSFGASLASLVGRKLVDEGGKVALCIIDAPSIETSQAFFQSQSIAVVEEILSLFNYAAWLPSPRQTQGPSWPKLTLELNELEELRQLALPDQLATLKNRFISANWGQYFAAEGMQAYQAYMEGLQTYLEIISQNLLSLIEHKDENNTRLPKIRAFTSVESQQKFQFDIAKSWQKFCERRVDATQVANSSHISLLKDDLRRHTIATEAGIFFDNSFTPQEVLEGIVSAWKKNHPEINLKALSRVGHLKNEQPDIESKDQVMTSAQPSASIPIPDRLHPSTDGSQEMAGLSMSPVEPASNFSSPSSSFTPLFQLPFPAHPTLSPAATTDSSGVSTPRHHSPQLHSQCNSQEEEMQLLDDELNLKFELDAEEADTSSMISMLPESKPDASPTLSSTSYQSDSRRLRSRSKPPAPAASDPSPFLQPSAPFLQGHSPSLMNQPSTFFNSSPSPSSGFPLPHGTLSQPGLTLPAAATSSVSASKIPPSPPRNTRARERRLQGDFMRHLQLGPASQSSTSSKDTSSSSGLSLLSTLPKPSF